MEILTMERQNIKRGYKPSFFVLKHPDKEVYFCCKIKDYGKKKLRTQSTRNEVGWGLRVTT